MAASGRPGLGEEEDSSFRCAGAGGRGRASPMDTSCRISKILIFYLDICLDGIEVRELRSKGKSGVWPDRSFGLYD